MPVSPSAIGRLRSRPVHEAHRICTMAPRSGCEPLPWRTYGNGGRGIASPLGMWGEADDDIWVFGVASFLWRRR